MLNGLTVKKTLDKRPEVSSKDVWDEIRTDFQREFARCDTQKISEVDNGVLIMPVALDELARGLILIWKI